ncbi:unnamed protein product [Urochloa humidicola]
MAPPSPPRRPPDLMEEIVEEVLLRFPPDEPASLVRAALVSRRWCRLISGGRFRELHRVPPMLGFVCNVLENFDDDDSQDDARFVPTFPCLPHATPAASGGTRSTPATAASSSTNAPISPGASIPWIPSSSGTPSPVRSCSCRIYQWSDVTRFRSASTRPCSARPPATTDHHDCNRGPFLVIFVGIYNDGMAAYLYSSEAGAWSEPTIAQHPRDYGPVQIQEREREEWRKFMH